MKFKFVKEQDLSDQFDTTRVTIESSAETITELLTDFADFLKACGYSLPNNNNPIVLNDEE